ncbi:MAG: hypothetical protein SPD11_11310 [Sphaerochaetaceae bacterium]|nr:hypothetical protein [Sphaerochaetaceae bacterium]
MKHKVCIVLALLCAISFSSYATSYYGVVDDDGAGRLSIGVGYQIVHHEYQSYKEDIKAIGINVSGISYFGNSPVGLWLDMNCVVPLSIMIDNVAIDQHSYFMCNGMVGPAFAIRPSQNLSIDLGIGLAVGYYDMPSEKLSWISGWYPGLKGHYRIVDLGVAGDVAISYEFGKSNVVLSVGCAVAWNFFQSCFYVITDSYGNEGSSRGATVTDFKYGLDIRPYVGLGWSM